MFRLLAPKGTDSVQTHKIAAVGSVSFHSQFMCHLFSPLWRLCPKLITNEIMSETDYELPRL
jgi:hypothetical protein